MIRLTFLVLCVVALILALGMNGLPFMGETPTPLSIQKTIFDNVSRSVR